MSFRIPAPTIRALPSRTSIAVIGFLRDCLGFELISKAPRDAALVSHITGVEGAEVMIAFLKAPGHTLELIEYRAPAARRTVSSRPCDSGFAHVAFNVDDVPAAVEAVKHYGVKPIAAPIAIDQGPNKGRKVVYLRDWDGITIELIEAK